MPAVIPVGVQERLDPFLFPFPAAQHPRLGKGCSLVEKKNEKLFSLSLAQKAFL